MSISVTVSVTDASRTDVTDVNGVVRQETRNFDVRIFAPDDAGDYPVVFWSPGHFSDPATSGGATNPQALADQGFIVLVATTSIASPIRGNSFRATSFPWSSPAPPPIASPMSTI